MDSIKYEMYEKLFEYCCEAFGANEGGNTFINKEKANPIRRMIRVIGEYEIAENASREKREVG